MNISVPFKTTFCVMSCVTNWGAMY